MNLAVAEALTWVGTPYRHQASVKGVGCDCIGLVRGVWRALSGDDVALAAYTPDWAEVGGREALLDGLSARFAVVELGAARPGDVLAFRMRSRSPAKHVAILSAGGVDDRCARIVHAYWGHAVVQSWLQPVWRRHVVAVFRFPLDLLPRKPIGAAVEGAFDRQRPPPSSGAKRAVCHLPRFAGEERE